MKPNWALIAILAGFAVTLAAVVVIVVSPPQVSGPELLTADLVSVASDGPSTAMAVVRHDDGCFFVAIDDVEHFAIWPEGFVRDGESAVAPDGTRYSDGSQFTANSMVSSEETIIGDDEYMHRVAASCNADDIAVVFSIR